MLLQENLWLNNKSDTLVKAVFLSIQTLSKIYIEVIPTTALFNLKLGLDITRQLRALWNAVSYIHCQIFWLIFCLQHLKSHLSSQGQYQSLLGEWNPHGGHCNFWCNNNSHCHMRPLYLLSALVDWAAVSVMEAEEMCCWLLLRRSL